ncbi:MAG TPA: bifunctional shikimate kinase/3-dehydroquinate synthase [Gaiellaceae bacterium]|nr:bifunctional shikimate kinase/3-dehydroquinate synthase [Gaiellaceae bacterium]
MQVTSRHLNALDRHIALIGFMGAGKTTLGRELAGRLGREFFDLDRAIEERAGKTIAELFDERGEPEFRRIEAHAARVALSAPEPLVLSLGGGAPTDAGTREELEQAFVVLIEIDVESAWERVKRSKRPLARDEQSFRRLYDEREPIYRGIADAVCTDTAGIALAAAGVEYELGALDRLGELVPGDGPVALVTDSTVMGIYGARAQEALGSRLASSHELPAGEEAKSVTVLNRIWRELRLDRTGTVVALGGGCTTDVAGYAAASYLRGVPWVAVPTTLVGQVDAGIGGKTGIDIPEGKNLVGAFHWPARVVIDETLLETLPERERRQGMAELVKTRLLAARRLDVRGAASYKAAICLQDPHDHGPRRWLNLGHTFAHGLEAAADYDLPHGEAVALGLLAALRISGRDTDEVERELSPVPVRVDPDRAWEALLRDKKRTGDSINLVLLGPDGPYVEPRPHDEVRRELERLIA